jgi:hypothetical protein
MVQNQKERVKNSNLGVDQFRTAEARIFEYIM